MTRTFAALIAIAFLGLQHAAAQSGSGSSSRQPQRAGAATPGSGSGNATYGSAPRQVMPQQEVALEGFCPVCLLDDRKWVVGSTQYQAAFDGKLYRFPSAPTLASFRSEPAKYAPVLGGDDVVTFARTGKRVAGKLVYGSRHLDRHYFFENEANKRAFAANPTQYANADLALAGACAVCRVDMNSFQAGSPQVTAVHNGLRYQFVGPQQRQAFMANPMRYTTPPRPAGGSGSSYRPSPQPASGSTGR